MLDLERRHGLLFVAYVLAKVAALAVVLAVQIAIFRITVELGFALREAFGGEAPAEIYRRGPLISASYNWLAAVACATIAMIAYVAFYTAGFDEVPGVLQRLARLRDIKRRLNDQADPAIDPSEDP